MRIRSTKPEFWRSKTIAALDWDVRLVLKGLESYVDDNGVGKDDLSLIAADVFPRDLSRHPRDTLARLSEAISKLADAGVIVRYATDGEDLLYIDKWKDIQRVDRPNKGRFPRPDGTLEYTEPVNRDSYRHPRDTPANTPEILATGTGEQGNRGTEEQRLAPQDASPKTKRGKRIPGDWRPTEDTITWAKNTFPHLDLRTEFDKFMNHWLSASGQSSRKLDWDRAFKNWLHNARSPSPRAPTGESVVDAKVNDWLALAQPQLEAIGE